MDIRTTRFVCLSLMFFIICFLFTPFSQCVAGSMTEPDLKSSMIINPDKQFNFAEHCFSGKDYLTAVLEYKRFIYFFPEDHRVETAMYRIGMSYYLGEHFKEAIDSFNAVIDKYVDTDLSVKSYFMISDAYVKQYAFGPAVINLNNLITMTYDEEVRDEACYKTGWIYIETASWEEARRFQVISAIVDDSASFGDGSVQVGVDPLLSPMVLPARSLLEDQATDERVGSAPSDQSKRIGKIGLGFGRALVLIAVGKALVTHRPPTGQRGKGFSSTGGRRHQQVIGDMDLPRPVDPDQTAKRIKAGGAAVLVFAVSKARASSEAIVGVCARIAFEPFEHSAFLIQA